MAPRPSPRARLPGATLLVALASPLVSSPARAAPTAPATSSIPPPPAEADAPGPLLRGPGRAVPPPASVPASLPSSAEPSAEPPGPAPQPAHPPVAAHHPEPKYWAPLSGAKPDDFPAYPVNHEDEPFDPSERQNIFNQKISREWDPERIINTDRPDFTDVLPTVGKHVWQTESGAAFRHRVGENYTLNRVSVPETTIRLGLTERFELRLKWDSFLFSQRTGTAAEGSPAGKSAYGSDFLVGFKWMAVPQAGWLPGHTVLGTLTTRIGNGGPAQTLIQPGINWVYGWQMNKWLVLRGSTGVEFIIVEPQRRLDKPAPNFEPSSPSTIFDLHQSVVTYLQVVKRLGMYLEWFSFYDFGAERLHQHNGGVGFYIYLTPNIQIDLRGGGTLAGSVSEVFTGAGISFRGKYRYKQPHK